MNKTRWIAATLALGYFFLCAAGTKSAPASWNDIARVAAIESLAERGTWAIDESPWLDRTEDKVFLNGRFYSDKMPLLTWIAAGAYAALRRGAAPSLAPDCAQKSAWCAYYALTLLFVGVPASLLIALMYEFARRLEQSILVAMLGTLALGLGTMILPYSLVLNHHLPAAVSLFASFYLRVTRAARDERWIFGAGFFAALALMLDPLAGFFAVALLVITAIRFRRGALYFVFGALPLLALTAWLDYQIAGTIIPPYLIPNGYDYPGSVFPATVGGNGTPDDLPQYAFKMFFGAQGLIAYNPILLFALAGLVIVALTHGHVLRIESIVIAATFALLSFYLATRTGNLGGEAYGERWFVQAIPLLMAFLYFAPPLAKTSARVWRWITAPLFGIALTLSMFSSSQGAQNPWRYVPPPTHPTRNAETGAFGWRWNLRLPQR